MPQDRVKELLDILDSPDGETVELEHTDDVIDFVEFYNLKPGKFWVKQSTMTRLYKHWSSEPVTTRQFVTRANAYMPSIKRRKIRFYKVNRSSINITKEAYKFILARHKRPIPVVNQRKVFQFLKDKNVKNGKRYPIGARVIYYMFLDWCEEQKIRLAPISYNNFIGLLKQTFNHKKDKVGRLYFVITRNLRNDYLSPQREAAIIRFYNEKEKKHNTKKQSEVPQLETGNELTQQS